MRSPVIFTFLLSIKNPVPMPEKGGSSLHVGRAQAPLSEYLHEDGAKDAQEYLILYGFGDGQGE